MWLLGVAGIIPLTSGKHPTTPEAKSAHQNTAGSSSASRQQRPPCTASVAHVRKAWLL
jgi:hypothetical protein